MLESREQSRPLGPNCFLRESAKHSPAKNRTQQEFSLVALDGTD